VVQAAAEPCSHTGEFRSESEHHSQLRGCRRYLSMAAPAQEPPHPAEGLGRSWTPPKHLLLKAVSRDTFTAAA